MPDITLKSGERGILVGASRSGKSTLAEWLLRSFRKEYSQSRILVLDTKPRWRATKMADGTSTYKLYKAMAEGDRIEGAVSLQRLQDWPMVWDKYNNPTQTVIAQRIDGTHEENLRFQVACAELFWKTQNARRPSLCYTDEGMDFFNATSGAKGGSDILQRMYRSGGERNMASLMGMQRPKGINIQTMSEMSKAYVFRLLFEEDIKRLYDMGFPQNVRPPEEKYLFRYWDVSQPRVAPVCRLAKGKVAA